METRCLKEDEKEVKQKKLIGLKKTINEIIDVLYVNQIHIECRDKRKAL
ncbi:MAG: hypothetical protein GY714_09220 [Desulfobacterales bacterium]|nr:hypothetical protein [Desulfobacterales bacterium]